MIKKKKKKATALLVHFLFFFFPFLFVDETRDELESHTNGGRMSRASWEK